MEEVKKKKKAIYFLVLFLVLIVLWIVFGASFTANTKLAIVARNLMFKYVGTSTLWFYYTLRPLESINDMGGNYKYKWIGYIESMDYVNNEMLAKDRWGREWKFRFFTQASKQAGVRELMFNQQRYLVDGSSEMEVRYLKIIDNKPLKPALYFSEGEQVAVFFGDSRKVNEIMSARVKGEVFELKGSGIIPIVRVVVEGEL